MFRWWNMKSQVSETATFQSGTTHSVHRVSDIYLSHSYKVNLLRQHITHCDPHYSKFHIGRRMLLQTKPTICVTDGSVTQWVARKFLLQDENTMIYVIQCQNMLKLSSLAIQKASKYKEVVGKYNINCVCWVVGVPFSKVLQKKK